jgi:hypothetical protein
MDNLTRGVVAGFIATTVISLILVLKEVTRILYGLDLFGLLTGVFNAPEWAGWVMHYIVGAVVYGGLFAALAPRLPGATCVIRGIVFAIGMWLVMQLVVLPLAGANFFGIRFSFWAPVVTLALHLIYGVILGGTFAWLKGHWHVHHEHETGEWRNISGGKAPAG